jgi:hypothetical protein
MRLILNKYFQLGMAFAYLAAAAFSVALHPPKGILIWEFLVLFTGYASSARAIQVKLSMLDNIKSINVGIFILILALMLTMFDRGRTATMVQVILLYCSGNRFRAAGV